MQLWPKMSPTLGSRAYIYQLFLEYGHVAYQIKGNEAYNNMLANNLFLILPLNPWIWVKRLICFFSEVVMLHILLIGMKHRTTCKQMFCLFTQPRPLYGVKRSNIFCEEGYVAIKMFDLMHTPDLLGWIKRSDIEIVQISII